MTIKTRKMGKRMLMVIFLAAVFFFGIADIFAVALPQVQTNTATNIQTSSATLNGYVSDLGGYTSVSVWFQWGISTSYGNSTGSFNQNYTGDFSQQITNLAPNQVFHYRVVAQNSSGIVYGQDVVFTTGQTGSSQITVSAGFDIQVSSGQSYTLQGSAYDNQGGYIYYSWSCTGGTLSNYATSQPTYTAPYISVQTSYTCTLVASNLQGQSNSDSIMITVASGGSGSGSLMVQTNPATYTYNNQATLNGYLSGGSLYNARAWFQWGISTSYGYESAHQPLQSSGNFSQNIANLIANQTYHYRTVVQDNYGNIVYGQDVTFVSTGNNTSYNPYIPYYPVPPASAYSWNFSQVTQVPTGITDNLLSDSFFLPLVALIGGALLWKSKLIDH